MKIRDSLQVPLEYYGDRDTLWTSLKPLSVKYYALSELPPSGVDCISYQEALARAVKKDKHVANDDVEVKLKYYEWSNLFLWEFHVDTTECLRPGHGNKPTKWQVRSWTVRIDQYGKVYDHYRYKRKFRGVICW